MRLARFFSFFRYGFCIALMLAIGACSSRSPEPAGPESDYSSPLPADPRLTPEELLSEARSVWKESRDEDHRNELLLRAAALYLQNRQPVSAQQVLKALENEPLTEIHQIRANLLIAKIYLTDPQADAEKLLSLVSPVAANENIAQEQLLVRAELFTRLQNWAPAADALIRASEPSAENVSRVWQWVNNIPDDQVSTAQSQYPALQPYIALRELIGRYGLVTSTLRREVVRFKQVYREHPLILNWPEAITEASSLRKADIEEITVLLPLSGRLEATGNTIKEGIMAAYFANLDEAGRARQMPSVRFIDTVDQTPEMLVEHIGSSKWVLGPLLKENVEMLDGRLPPSVTMLALNRLDSPLAPVFALEVDILPSAQTAYFALAPEDEAHQLAEHIFHSGYRAPIVVSSQSSINQRMYEAFHQRWQQLNEQALGRNRVNLTSVTFSDSNTLREGITQALDVAQSKERINQIRYMVNEELYNVPRNRRDVDAIMVFASPEQTELLNPMVEASLSPFTGKTVPVYATSRSLEYDSGKNQWRDLQNVRFLDMPWMLPGETASALKHEVGSLWQDRSTQSSRLFAFGFDAYNLLPHLQKMALLPQVSVAGLTGELSMNAEGEIMRLLPQAIINNEKVMPVTNRL